MKRYFLGYLLPVLVIFLAACGSSSGAIGNGQQVQAAAAIQAGETDAQVSPEKSAQNVTTEQEGCPVTQTTDPPFTPPPPYGEPESGFFWYGSPELWTMLPEDGAWADLPLNETGYTQKVFWGRQGYDYLTEPEPDLVVTGKRLDEPAALLAASKATNAYQDPNQSFMLVGVDFPSPGCWEITGQYGDNSLSFVVWVAPE